MFQVCGRFSDLVKIYESLEYIVSLCQWCVCAIGFPNFLYPMSFIVESGNDCFVNRYVDW